MRVLVMNRCLRLRLPRLRSVRGRSAYWSHAHSYALRPNYEFHPLKFQDLTFSDYV